MIKILNKFKTSRTWFSVLCAMAFFTSCQEDVTNYKVGDNFVNDPSYVVLIDTLSIESESYLVDSIVTSGLERIVVGRIENDPQFGSTEVSTRFHVFANSLPTQIKTSAAPDSLVLELNYDGYYVGDTTQTQTINVYQLREYLEPDELFGNDTENFYNIHPIDFNEDSLYGSFDFTPFPTSVVEDRVVRFNMGEKVMNNLWNRVRFKDDDLETEHDFLYNVLPGIVLTPGDGSTQLTGFSGAFDQYSSGEEGAIRGPRLVMYYHDIDEENQTFEFPLVRPQYQYNYFNPTFAGTNLAAFDSDRTVDVDSRDSDDEIYLQGGNGVALKLDFGDIYKLGELGVGMVTYAELAIYPKVGTYDLYDHQLPSVLDAYVLDQRDDVVGPLTDLSGTQQIRAYLYTSQDEDGTALYTLDLTSYIRDEFLQREDTERKISLQISTSNNANSSKLDQVVFDSQFGEENDMELRLYYVVTE